MAKFFVQNQTSPVPSVLGFGILIDNGGGSSAVADARNEFLGLHPAHDGDLITVVDANAIQTVEQTSVPAYVPAALVLPPEGS